MPLLRELGIMDGVTRASAGLYTTKEEIDLLIAGLEKARRIFRL
jgi:cysteine desulfurase/selenocysteine lyase